jgi:nucleoside-diphosphate-sugar epimerase
LVKEEDHLRILVIGGTGFIGSCVVSELRRAGHEVATFARHGDIAGDRRSLAASASQLHRFEAHVVVDMILSSGRQARDVIDTFHGRVPRLVALSSCDVYRACGVLHRLEEGPLEPVPLTEESPIRTTRQTYPPEQIDMLKSVFGWLDDDYDKILVEQVVLGTQEMVGTVLRLPMVYGPGDRLHRLRPLVAHMDAGKDDFVMSESIAQWRGPRGFVKNVAHAVALAATHDAAVGRIYNVGEPHDFSEAEWAHRVADVVGWRGRITVKKDADAPFDPRLAGNLQQHWSIDTGRIRRELDYGEVVDVDDAIRQTVEWERATAIEQAGLIADGRS